MSTPVEIWREFLKEPTLKTKGYLPPDTNLQPLTFGGEDNNQMVRLMEKLSDLCMDKAGEQQLAKQLLAVALHTRESK